MDMNMELEEKKDTQEEREEKKACFIFDYLIGIDFTDWRGGFILSNSE